MRNCYVVKTLAIRQMCGHYWKNVACNGQSAAPNTSSPPFRTSGRPSCRADPDCPYRIHMGCHQDSLGPQFWAMEQLRQRPTQTWDQVHTPDHMAGRAVVGRVAVDSCIRRGAAAAQRSRIGSLGLLWPRPVHNTILGRHVSMSSQGPSAARRGSTGPPPGDLCGGNRAMYDSSDQINGDCENPC